MEGGKGVEKKGYFFYKMLSPFFPIVMGIDINKSGADGKNKGCYRTTLKSLVENVDFSCYLGERFGI